MRLLDFRLKPEASREVFQPTDDWQRQANVVYWVQREAEAPDEVVSASGGGLSVCPARFRGTNGEHRVSNQGALTSPRPKLRVIVLTVLAVVALVACRHDDDGLHRERPGAVTDGSGDASSNAAGEAEPERQAFIYTAVIEELVEESSYRRGRPPPFEVLFVLDGVVPRAEMALRTDDPQQPFGDQVKAGVRFLTALSELPPLEFVAEWKAAVVGTASGRPGEARDAGALITLGPIEGGGKRVEVGNSLWVNGLWGRWQTYVVAQRGGVWKVTGTTGPIAIS